MKHFVSNTMLSDFFASLPITNLYDLEILQKIIINNIGIKLNPKTMQLPEHYPSLYGGFRMKQYPYEMAKLLCFLFERKNEISSYIEIGVERGGTFFTIDSFMRTINPNFKNSIAIDRSNWILRNGFDKYASVHDGCRFCQMNSQKFVPDSRYDLCFIDGDHSYAGVKADFEKMKEYSRYIAFHDITCTLPNIEVKKLWDEIKNKYEHWEFVLEDKNFPVQMGIGVIAVLMPKGIYNG